MENKLKEYRKKAGMTQKDLANASGVTQRTICKIENTDEACVSMRTMTKISNALGYKVKTIFFN